MSKAIQQIPLNLKHIESQGREDFLVSDCNAQAAQVIDQWPRWANFSIIIQGAEACGKSHLLSIWAERSGAKLVSAEAFIAQGWTAYSEVKVLAIDGIDALIGEREAEQQLFHIYNHMKETGGHLLLASETVTKELDFVLPDLGSRLRSVPLYHIDQPDDALLAAILVKMFSDRNLRIGADVLNYVTPRIERSFGAARAFVDAADHRALATKRGITIPIAREVLLSE